MSLPTVVPIRKIYRETQRVRTFVLDIDLPDAEPGQFVMVWLPGVDEKPISIAAPSPLTLTVARAGPFTTALHRAREGDRVGVRGPLGRGFSLLDDRPALLVGGGYGVAPLYFLATRAMQRSIPTTVALGARTGGDLLYVERFRRLEVRLITATDDGSVGHQGYVTEAIGDLLATDPPPAVYACGPEPMLVTLLRLCLDHGLPGQFSVERYMKCGVGICGQCAIDGLLVCREGPVLTVDRLQGLRDFGRFRRTASGARLPIE